MQSRQDIILECYSKTVNIEALTMVQMMKRDIVPAVSTYIKKLSDAVISKKAIVADIPCEAEIDLIKKLSSLLDCAYKHMTDLDSAILGVKAQGDDVIAVAKYYRDSIISVMREIRTIVDEIEVNVGSEFWPYPTYGDLMFKV